MVKVSEQENLASQSKKLMSNRVIVLLENNEKGAWIVPELRRWFSPQGVEMALVQVMESVTHQEEEPSEFWEKVSHQRNKLHTIRKQYAETLERDGFNLVNDYVSDSSDRGCEAVLKSEQDLFVVGTSDDQQKNKSASSFTLYMATHAPSSVLVLKRLLDAGKDTISVLLATDGSEASLEAARKLPRFLPADRLEVTLIHVREIPIQQNPILAPYVNMESVDTALEQNSKMVLEMTQNLLEESGVNVIDSLFAEGAPTYELIHQAEKREPDLVVVGSHNRQGLTRWLLGSVSHRLVQSDNHNILVIR